MNEGGASKVGLGAKSQKKKTRNRHQCRGLLAHNATEFSKEGKEAIARVFSLLLLNTVT